MKKESRISVRTLTAMALLIAMSIVFSRVLSISTGFVRFNLGSLPVLLAGILFGPWAGFVVGMVADIIGGVLAGYAINPLITLGAASIGLVGGLGWQKLSHLRTGNRLGAVCWRHTSSARWSSTRWHSTSFTAMHGQCSSPASRMRWCSRR